MTFCPADEQYHNYRKFISVKNSLAQLKDQCNLFMFCVELESETNINMNDIGKTNEMTEFYVHRPRFKSKNMPYFKDGAKCFNNILNKGAIYMNTQQELQLKINELKKTCSLICFDLRIYV